VPNFKSPHYLSKGPKGVYYFRYVLSNADKAQLRQNELHWSLRTKDLRRARRLALTLHDHITNLLARGRDVNIQYSVLHKYLLDHKNYFIRDEIRKIDSGGPHTSEQRQALRGRISLRKVELRMQEPPDDVVSEAKQILEELSITEGVEAVKIVSNELLKMLIAADKRRVPKVDYYSVYNGEVCLNHYSYQYQL